MTQPLHDHIATYNKRSVFLAFFARLFTVLKSPFFATYCQPCDNLLSTFTQPIIRLYNKVLYKGSILRFYKESQTQKKIECFPLTSKNRLRSAEKRKKVPRKKEKCRSLRLSKVNIQNLSKLNIQIPIQQ